MEGIEKITARIIEDAEREIAQMQRENEEKIPRKFLGSFFVSPG